MNDRLRVGVAGCGVGVAHMDAFLALPDRFELVALCDIDAAKAEAVAAEKGVPRVYAGFDALCAAQDLDVIDICTPPYLHVPQVRQALASGKHVISEKPLAGSLQEADALIAAEPAAGRRVMPIFQYRFGHGLQRLKFLVDEGLTGRAYLATVETAWRRRAAYYAVPWRGRWQTELGGALVSHAIHAHDALCSIAGPVRSVFGRITTRVNPIETEDCAAASLEMADGSFATLSVTLGSAVEIMRHRFCFANLVAESNVRPYTNTGDPWTFTGDTPELDERISATLARFEPGPEGYDGQFIRFADALRDGGELPVTLADARASLELITALYHSARTLRAVELPITAEHPLYDGWRHEA
jgi:predicted dehydrogenase